MWFFVKKFLIDTFYVTRLNDPRPALFLFFPCCWGLLFCLEPSDILNIYIGLFFVACVCMYVVGCVVNDFFDRKIDALIPRTKQRLMAAKKYNPYLALGIASIFGLIALRILLLFSKTSIVIGIISACMAVIYPFAKRITHYVQFFLGITVGSGVLVGYSSACNSISLGSVIMCIGTMYWTVVFDTIYGYQDKEYDIKIGVKSLTILLGDDIKKKLLSYATMMMICFMFAGRFQPVPMSFIYYIFVFLGYIFLMKIVKETNLKDPDDCYGALAKNTLVGFIIAMGCYFGRIVM